MRREDVTGKKRIQTCSDRPFGHGSRARSAVRRLLYTGKMRRGKLVQPGTFCRQPKGSRGAVEQTYSQALFKT
jgi:hypothetical protein